MLSIMVRVLRIIILARDIEVLKVLRKEDNRLLSLGLNYAIGNQRVCSNYEENREKDHIYSENNT